METKSTLELGILEQDEITLSVPVRKKPRARMLKNEVTEPLILQQNVLLTNHISCHAKF